jgi:hypothetical protein
MPMRKASVTPRAVSAANRRHKKAAAAALEGTAAAPSSEAK